VAAPKKKITIKSLINVQM